MKTLNKILVIGLVLCITLSIGCMDGNEVTGYTVDVGFRDGSHETYRNIADYEVVHHGVLSDTVELHTVLGSTITLHYVTSIDVR